MASENFKNTELTETTPQQSSGLTNVEDFLAAFSLFGDFFEGALAVDAEARITWVDARYRKLLNLSDDFDPTGRPIEEVIPHSLMRAVVETGRPILLDIMDFNDRKFVVCRVPLRDENGKPQGAFGFVFYDNVDYLKPILSKFDVLKKQLTRAQEALTKERQTKYSLSNFVGTSDAVMELKSLVRRFALREGPALILGETGTGKELLAHAIHQSSDRADGPFVAVNMAAVPEALLEAEFFGTAPGAFTGADKKQRKGKFELAHGGTLFLDEIGDMPLSIQAKFLRTLQEGEIEPLGSNSIKKVNVRIIAATSQDLEQKLEDKSFRADLYYRIAVLTVNVPPLRDRLGDIPLLCERLLEQTTRMSDMRAWTIEPEAISVLQSYSWPGNVRELRNVLERATALAPTEVLDAQLVFKAMPRAARDGAKLEVIGKTAPFAPVNLGSTGDSAPQNTLADAIADAEKNAIIHALSACNGHRSAAAQKLGVSRSQFYEKLKRHELM